MNPRQPAQSHNLQPLRANWLDTARGFGIILVVFGHVLRGLVSAHVLTWTSVTKFLDGWIYTFHMPLFFFLSGLLLFKSMKSSWKGFLWGKVRTIVYPYFVWSVITIAIKSVFGSLTSHPYHLSDLPVILYQPIDQFWFLYVLFLLFLVVSALLKLGAKPWVVLSLAVLFYCGILPVPIQWGILFETRAFAIYFSLGVCIGWARDLTSLSRVHMGLLLFIIASGLALSSLGGFPQLSDRAALRPLLALAGTAAFVALAVLASKCNLDRPIRFIGRHALEIYVAHTIASAGVRIALLYGAHLSAPAPYVVLGTLAGLYLPIALVLVFDRLGFRFAFVLPAAAPLPRLFHATNQRPAS